MNEIFSDEQRSVDYAHNKAYNDNAINTGRSCMKRKDLIKLLEDNGWYLIRNGANHDIYTNGQKAETIPRHREIDENLAKAIIKRQGLK